MSFETDNFVDLIDKWTSSQGERLAFKFLTDGENEEINMTYGELHQKAKAIAAMLQNSNMQGQRVLLLYEPGLEYISAFFGCLYAGAIAVPAYPPDPTRLHKTLPRLQTIIENSQAPIILTSSRILSFFRKIAIVKNIAKIPFLNKLGESISGRLGFTGIDFDNVEWVASDKVDINLQKDWKKPDVNGDTIAFLQYTSGSTGDPKGVVLTHGNLLHNQKGIQGKFKTSDKTVVVSWLPLYHDMGLIGKILHPVFLGVHCVFMSPLHFLQKPMRWLQAVSKHRGTISFGPNFAFDLCVRKAKPEIKKNLDLSSWDCAGNGAEAIHKETLDRFVNCFGECGFSRGFLYPSYGLAEGSLIASARDHDMSLEVSYFSKKDLLDNIVTPLSPDDPESMSIVSCGTAIVDQKIAIVCPDTLELCADGKIGEIWLHGSSISQGYWQKPDVNSEVFGLQPKGWQGDEKFMRTGDLGFFWKKELYVTGRIKDLIIIAGQNYYPQDIEKTVENSHVAVRKGCSAAFSCSFDNEEKLIVVAEVKNVQKTGIKKILSKEKESYDPLEIVKELRKAINENHQISVKKIVLLKEHTINKTSSGKIQRRACKSNYIEAKLQIIYEG